MFYSKFLKKHVLAVTTLVGALIGYLFLHPFGMVVHSFFNLSVHEGHVHINGNGVLKNFIMAFGLEHFPPALIYSILFGIVGFFIGKLLLSRAKIRDYERRFTAIGMETACIIHDLKNPLSVIAGYVTLLKKQPNYDEQKHFHQRIEKQVMRISGMIEDIRVGASGKSHLNLLKEPIEIKSFLERIISTMDLDNSLTIDCNYNEHVLLDRDYMERVFWNLIKNADEALGSSSKDGKIEVIISKKNKMCCFLIKDNGSGISSERLNEIFSLAQLTEKKGGSGIGLFNCKNIIEAHGGDIKIDSGTGIGTNVYISIPVLDKKPIMKLNVN